MGQIIKRTLLLSTVLFRTYLAFNGIISDCDETFNYWEPLNLLVRGFGKQTWEYSPEYGIRSWCFLIPLSFILKLAQSILSHTQLFYLLRFMITAFSVVSDLKFFHELNKLDQKIGPWYLLFLIVMPGMSHSTISLLPSSFAMNCITLSNSYILQYLATNNLSYCYNIVFWFTIGGLTGWPFILVLAVPILCYITLSNIGQGKLLLKFISGSLFIFVVILGLITYIDSKLYANFTVVPLNAVLYNVWNSTEESGPNIFGVEPLSYYILNLLLNFNVVTILSYAGLILLPLINLVTSDANLFEDNKRLVTLISPMAIWSVIFGLQPHKEERFLYPIYSYVMLTGAIFCVKLFDILKMVMLKLFRYKKVVSVLHKLSITITVFIISALSILRVLSLIQNYSSPLAVYAHLPQDEANVCVGREWYHFPTSFFLNDNQRLKFTKSGFNGILPGDFKESDNILDSISNVPANMNNKNIFEADKVTEFSECDYYIDINKDVDLESGEEQIFTDIDGILQIHDDWEFVYCDKFIDVDNSYGIGRILALPDFMQRLTNSHIEYFNYCLVKKKS